MNLSEKITRERFGSPQLVTEMVKYRLALCYSSLQGDKSVPDVLDWVLAPWDAFLP